jgi:hypothetical protein
MRNYYTHTIPSMLNLAKASEDFLSSLPTEFSKKEFEALRAACPGKPMSFASARKYGIIAVVREEPSSYKSLTTVFTDPKGRQYFEDELRAIGRTAVEYLFDVHSTDRWFSLYSLPNAEVEVEHPCVKNIYSVDLEKFKSFL